MKPERFGMGAAVYGLLIENDRVLLMRRAGSGYRDGELGLPSGHLDGGEDAISGLGRELQEELDVSVDPTSCQLVVLIHRAPENAEDREYLDLIFTVGRWEGTPRIGEPTKCTELVWADRNHLPSDLVDYVGAALHAYDADERLLLHGWGSMYPGTDDGSDPEDRQ